MKHDDLETFLRYDDETSMLLKQEFKEEIENFTNRFKNNEDCRKQLLKERKWRLLKDDSLSLKCPHCKRGVIAPRKKKRNYERKIKDPSTKGKVEVQRFQYRCPSCRKDFNTTTNTLFKRQSDKLWLWFYTLFCMALVNGRVPRTLIIKDYYNLLVSEGELFSSENSSTLKKSVFIKLGRQVDTAAKKLSLLFKEKNKNKRKKYLRYVGFKKSYRTNYLEWYSDREKRKKWNISWTPGVCDIDNKIALKTAKNRNIKNIHDVQYLQKRPNNVNKSWVLCFVFNRKKGVKSIRWLYVDRVTMMDYDEEPIFTKIDPKFNGYQKKVYRRWERIEHKRKFARYQLIQVVKNVKTIQRPFKITKEFIKAFKRVVREYGLDKLKAQSNNNLLNCPTDILHDIAIVMKNDIDLNTELDGSWDEI